MIFQRISINTNYIRHLISVFPTVTDGVIDTVTRLQAARSGVRIAARASTFSVPKVYTDPGAHTASYLIDIWIISRRLKRPGLEAYNSHLYITQFKNEWSCTSSLTACFRGMNKNFNIFPSKTETLRVFWEDPGLCKWGQWKRCSYGLSWTKRIVCMVRQKCLKESEWKTLMEGAARGTKIDIGEYYQNKH